MTELDDLDRQCAEALAWKWADANYRETDLEYDDSPSLMHHGVWIMGGWRLGQRERNSRFFPTRNPAQAMALLEMMPENVQLGKTLPEFGPNGKTWCCWVDGPKGALFETGWGINPCIAITRAFIAWKAAS